MMTTNVTKTAKATGGSSIRTTLEMIKIEHTLFALPFAFLGALLAARGLLPGGLPTLRQAVWITLAMVGARSCAMAFNRIADRHIDAANPRTRARAIPAGLLSLGCVGLHQSPRPLFCLPAGSTASLCSRTSRTERHRLLVPKRSRRSRTSSRLVAPSPRRAWIAVRGPWLARPRVLSAASCSGRRLRRAIRLQDRLRRRRKSALHPARTRPPRVVGSRALHAANSRARAYSVAPSAVALAGVAAVAR